MCNYDYMLRKLSLVVITPVKIARVFHHITLCGDVLAEHVNVCIFDADSSGIL